MAVRFRVYPNGMAGTNRTAVRYAMTALKAQANVKVAQANLAHEKQVGALRLGYERSIFGERLKRAELAAAIKYGRGGLGFGASPYAAPLMMGGAALGAGMLMPGIGVPGFGGMQGCVPGFGGMPGYGLPGYGMPMAGRGQVNVTNQHAAGAANQSVSNTNTYNSFLMPGGFGAGLMGAGGWMGGLFNRLF